MKNILKEFVEEVCTTCKGECHKGITFVFGDTKKVQCVDYIKDETKIKKPKKELYSTANKQKPIMKDLV